MSDQRKEEMLKALAKQRRFGEVIHHKKMIFFTLYVLFIAFILTAACVATSVTNDCVNLAKTNKDYVSSAVLFGISSSFCFALFILSVVFIYRIFRITKIEANRIIQKECHFATILFSWFVVIIALLLCCQIAGNIILFDLIRKENLDPFTYGVGQCCFVATWFACLSLVFIIPSFVFLIDIKNSYTLNDMTKE